MEKPRLERRCFFGLSRFYYPLTPKKLSEGYLRGPRAHHARKTRKLRRRSGPGRRLSTPPITRAKRIAKKKKNKFYERSPTDIKFYYPATRREGSDDPSKKDSRTAIGGSRCSRCIRAEAAASAGGKELRPQPTLEN